MHVCRYVGVFVFMQCNVMQWNALQRNVIQCMFVCMCPCLKVCPYVCMYCIVLSCLVCLSV